MRIAHISDLHLCTLFKEKNYLKLEKALITALKNGVQHFVFSGDITDNANEEDFKNFKSILKKYNIYNSLKATITIGNHDIFGGPQTANDVISFPSKCLKINYIEKVKEFIDHFKELFENTITINNEINFPFLKIVHDNAFLIINSIDEYSRFKNPFASNGKVNKEIRKKIIELSKNKEISDKTKIAVIHHHFYHNYENASSSENNLWNKIENFTMKLKHKKKLINLFNECGVKIVLHGHSHEMKEYIRNGIHFFNSGGAFEGNAIRMFIINAFKFDLSYEIIDEFFIQSDNEIYYSKSLAI
ncbi:MAG: metallophosphoesterase [Melioribacteraceae bacterium]|nr:metallophosphoesterase [Melioribacteraceae bacterium]